MNPFLVFLNAARNLASMGMKKEQVLDFAKNEFGELTGMMKYQIDNIYKPKKPVDPKNPDFDDTVVKMKFDDEGKPFNPRDPLKDYSKKDKKADGGRIGLKDGLGVLSLEDIGFLMEPSGKKIPSYMLEGFQKDPKLSEEQLKEILKKIKEKDFKKKDPIQLMADGGRIGLRDGVPKEGIDSLPFNKDSIGSFPMKRDGFLISPDFDKLTEEQKMYMEGMKIQEKKRQKKLREFLDKLKESLPENERNIKPVPFPDRPIPESFKKGLASGGRVGFKKGLLASMMEGITPDGGIFQSIFANRKHPILSTLNATELLSLGEALRPVIGFNEGGRVGLKSGTGIFKGLKKFLMPGADDKLERQLLGTELGYEGLNNLMQLLQGSGLFASGGRVGLKDGPQDPKRRSILKMIGGGLMSLPILSKLKFLAPLAPTIKKAAERGIDVAPTYFFDLVNKIKMFGKQGKGAEDRVTEYNYKNYSLEENVSDGTQRITIKKGDPEVSYKEEIMEYTPPKMEEDIGQLPAQYDEVTVRPDMDGKMKDIEDGIDDISEILEEVKKSAPPIKKAAGGLAYMLGE
jgi:hypothetical protein